MPRPSASPALRVLRTLRTGSRMTLRRHKDFLALAALCRKSPATADYSPSGHSALPWLAALVEWTEQGQQLIRDKAYRYLSPVFAFNAESQQILQLHSAGLTNQPNLPLTALNQQQGEMTMSLNIALCRALNLPEASPDEAIIAKAQALFKETEPTSLEAMVPRADYDLALNRAQAAEAKVQHIEEEQQQAAIELAINQALEQGVITPATADYHRACCRQAGGLEQFQDFVSKAPKVVSDVAFNHANIDDHGLTDDERLVCELLGVNEDIFQQKEAN